MSSKLVNIIYDKKNLLVNKKDELSKFQSSNIHKLHNYIINLENDIKKINKLYDNGDEITYWTARGANSGKNWYDHTYKQLLNWGCKFHYLKCNKPHYDLWIDDKAVSDTEFFKALNETSAMSDYYYEGIPPHG